ncbi:MAG: hypothetical protein EKK46_00275 [Rhodocyclaceae bacterium]|nr:MAG: hypothetical protein EKK46_00275 [Rhodocyclaceae bacterium]
MIIVIVGSVAVSQLCFPAQSHGPVNPWCDLALLSPLLAGVAAGLLFGWKLPFASSPLAFLVPLAGLGLLFLSGHLRYWYGQDIGAAAHLVAIYCLLPTAIASAISAITSARWGANAL